MKLYSRKNHTGGWWYAVLLVLVIIMLGIGTSAGFAQDEGGETPAVPADPANAVPVPTSQPARIAITKPDINRFPNVGFYFPLVNAQGVFIRDLQKVEVQVLENNYDRPIQDLNIVQPGVQIIAAINADPTLANKIGELTYFQYLQRDLQAWAQGQPANTPDDFSLSTNTGLQSIREKQPLKWATSIGGYTPDLKNSESSLLSLTQALDLATDPNPNPFMKRAILYITGLPGQQNLAALPNLAGRAVQMGVRVFVWVMTTPSEAIPQNLAPLEEFATTTGGKFFAFTGKEALPNPNGYFEPMRYLYLINYTSGVKNSGDNRVLLRIERDDLQAVSEEQTFSMKISPPNPIFMDPPVSIQREWVMPPGSNQVAALQPQEVPLRVLVEFPDGKPRPLKAMRLLVDGAVKAENTTHPFDRIIWPVQNFEKTGPHLLVVEVEDSLGLKSSSIETMINVQVQAAKQPTGSRFFTLRGLAILVALLAAAGVLGLALGEVRSSPIRRMLHRARQKKDPLTQPVIIRSEPRRLAGAFTPTIPRPAGTVEAPARLLRLSEGGNPIPASALSISRRETTLGSDPVQAIYTLDSSSVDQLHARILRAEDGSFQVFDAGSIAGTWVNYCLVPETGINLQHGDMINLGRVAFRFELSAPGFARQPRVTPFVEEPL